MGRNSGQLWQRGHSGADHLSGGDGASARNRLSGDDVFVYHGGDGDVIFHGGPGTDVIELDSVADGWTVQLRRGEILSNDVGYLSLSAGAVGVITFADGSTLRFNGVEGIQSTPTNQAPSIVALSASSVYEAAADGTVVGTVSATDADAGDTLTYALLDDAGGRFAIDPATGEITVADGSLLDHEAAEQHNVVVAVTDSGGLTDTATYTIAVQFDNSGDDALTGDGGDNVIDGGPGNDQIYGQDGNDHLIGGSGNDHLQGGDGDDVLDGGDGDDVLNGWTGSDQLSGGAGQDMLFGSSGNDWLSGGAGNDSLSGGSGNDQFLFDATNDGVDTISDFGAGDVLVFSGLQGFTAGREADYVSLLDNGVSTTVLVDVDGAADGAVFDPVAVLNGFSGSSLAELVNARQIDIWATA